jgi:hypothetical protein
MTPSKNLTNFTNSKTNTKKNHISFPTSALGITADFPWIMSQPKRVKTLLSSIKLGTAFKVL